MAPSTPKSMLAQTFKEEDPEGALLKIQMANGLKDFREFRDQRSGEPHQESDYNTVFERLQRGTPRPLNPLVPDPRGPMGMEIVFVETPNPPCTSELAELKPVLLSELGLNTHHRGRVLLGKFVGIVDVTWKNTLAAVEDPSGDVELLDLHFVCMNKQAGKTWPKLGSWLAIKEPFFTVEEIFVTECIRVDHPSDLVRAEDWPLLSIRYGELDKTFLDNNERTPLEWKQAGNAALAAKDFDAAHTCYTQGINAAIARPRPLGQDSEKDLHRNRSYVRLTLGYYEGAVKDAITSLTYLPDDDHKKLDAKANFRAARASYSLKNYDEAIVFLRAQLELSPDDKDAVTLRKRAEGRLREQHDGVYDIAKIQRSLSREPRVDAADYIVNTTINESGPKRGRGLFATCDLQPGQLIMAETSFCCVWRHEDANLLALECNASTPDEVRPNLVGLWRSAVNEAGKNPRKGGHLMQLHGNYKSTGEQVKEIDGIAAVDAFQVHDIVACNSFSLLPINQTDVLDYERLVEGSSAIWIRLSYANHSCIPNSQKTSYGDLVLLHATQPIAKDEEITLNYSGDRKDFEARTKQMRSNWGFQCECRLCGADAQCRPADLIARANLYKEAMLQYADSPPSRRQSLSLLPKFERYVEDINRTYRGSQYVGLPKIHLLQAQNWLLEASITAHDRPKARQATINILQTLGFEVDTEGESIKKITFTVNSMLPKEAMTLLSPLVGQAIEARRSGNVAVAEHLLNFAKVLERVNYGTNTQTLKVCQHHLSQLFGTPENVAVERMAELGL